MSGARWVLVSVCGLSVAPLACGGNGDSPPAAALFPDLKGATASVAGGGAEGAPGTATAAGALKVISRGEISIDPTGAAAPGMTPPPTPSGGDVVAAADLAADLSRDGTIRIEGNLTTGGSDAVRTITSAAGDIVIAGTLRGADLGSSTQRLSLNAPAGVVYIAGAIDTSGAAATASGAGDAGGEISISARSIVVTGRIDASGGEARGGGAVTGGAAGSVRLTASGGDIWIARVQLHGGAAKSDHGAATGGAGATMTVDATGTLWVTGLIDARGGPAIAANAAGAGAAGAITIGQTGPPSRVVMGDLGLQGGTGTDAGGSGGALALEARGGDLRVAGTIDASGGGSRGQPGNAGTLDATTGPDAGGFVVLGRIVGDGGDAMPGGNAPGGTGARLRFRATSLTGGYTVTQAGAIQLDGGDSSGSGTAGAGGDMEMLAIDGGLALPGKLLARGGTAPDPGGIGGQGGILHVWTDMNTDGVGGNQIIEPTGLIDVSGGAGTIGGSGRNNGGQGVALFPEHMEQLSVLLDGETIGGNSTDGIVDNQGLIASRGGAHNGAGGDVMFHGRQPTGEDKTVPGRIEQQGDGTGASGDFAGE